MPQNLLCEYVIGQQPAPQPKHASSKARRIPLVVGNGNSKLGQIWNFSLPALVSCPGASPLCKQYCYVKIRNFGPSVQTAYQLNFEVSQRPDFAQLMIAFLQGAYLDWKQGQARVFRLHPAGDFYSADYIRHWITIAQTLSDWVFYGYTRTRAVPKLAENLGILRDLNNVHLYASVDQSMPSCDWPLQVWMTKEAPSGNMVRCLQERSLLVRAFRLWKREQGKPDKSKVRPHKEELRKVALAHGIRPLFCSDCGYCLYGRGSVWFKLRSNQFL